MPYVAKHTASCKDKDLYRITREVVVIENRLGSILNDRDQGKVISIQCESCHAPAVWK